MTRRAALRAAGLLVFLAASIPVFAHPHVFIDNTMRAVFDGPELIRLEFRWSFDELFSGMILQDFHPDGSGRFSAGQIAGIKKNAFDNLKNYHYFVAFFLDGKPMRLPPIENFSASVDGDSLIYSFSLPFALRVDAGAHSLGAVIYDDTYYVAFKLMKVSDVTLVSAGAVDCAVSIEKTKVKAVWPGQYMPDEVVLAMKGK